ncbi:CCAAT/enhancer-binding protein 2 [Drosophila grimshawi]|uniref:GH16258 n=1 Tax=Drosophila grimshawi TaxID=7222 RepID=B4IXT8_DROGR|nr:CCAAT/enhancer-binding protein 2 [Drosophila grimshawi]EDV96459.1 GH16258 [Drosophila grimshawi]
MPAKRSTAKPSTSRCNADRSPQSDDSAYKMKRKKNNEAVQRTREKTKKSAEDRKDRIERLKIENIDLLAQIRAEKRHIGTLRDLIIQGKKTEEQDRQVDEILRTSDEDDDDNNDN